MRVPNNTCVMKRLLFAACVAVCALAVLALCINIYMVQYAKPYIYRSLEALPGRYVVIVPGGRVYANTVSPAVRDRLSAASECLNGGKAERVLLSGDHGRKGYDEVNQMRRFMLNTYGTDEALLFMDHAGFSTYETMYRARDVFCVTNAVIVTQRFHLARSVYIARKLGIDAVGYEAREIAPFSTTLHANWELREALARVKNFFLVCTKAKPRYLGEQIPITGDAKKSWD